MRSMSFQDLFLKSSAMPTQLSSTTSLPSPNSACAGLEGYDMVETADTTVKNSIDFILDEGNQAAIKLELSSKRKARICKEPGCDKHVVDHGLCIRHGVGWKRYKMEDCNCRAQN
ncbi:unnamed protein product [Peronospora destructor]|uniref:WRKY19-like zinc finger domain-containing protein n=1 Tax=Peronospora destructor TaxID=86335 RepID=A0AAV0TSS2_9STRA|nr:unnamed protein product [Peronospora destructor]